MSSNKLGELIASKWRGLASKESRRKRSKGHFVFYAKGGKRFLVPLKYLDHPIFRVLLEVAEEEFGNVAGGPLRVPCEEELMDRLVSLLDSSCIGAGDPMATEARFLLSLCFRTPADSGCSSSCT